MKKFRYILVPLGLALMASGASGQSLTTAYDLTAGSGYTGQQGFGGTLGMEFDVNAQSIKITSLGVFDSGGDGFHNVLTTYLFNADTHALIASQSFSGTSDSTAGALEGNNRFIDIPGGIVLGPGNYVIAAGGFSSLDLNGNATYGGFVSDTFNDGGGLITMVSPSLYAEAVAGAGAYPSNTFGGALEWNAGTFQYSLNVPEPGSISLAFVLMGGAGSLLGRRVRRLRSKKSA